MKLTTTSKTKKKKLNAENMPSKEEKLDEDVPAGFFDDFMKDDFMAGLDIVDEDNEVEETNDSNPKLKGRKDDQTSKKKSNEKIDHVKKFRESPPDKNSKSTLKKNKKDLAHQKELKRLDKELNKIKNTSVKKVQKSGINADDFDIRRDPEKTRQSIQKDKIKSAKDKEKRLITDIVETGLVPPGMELEVGLDEVQRIEKTKQVIDLREKISAKKSRSKSHDNQRGKNRKRSPLRRSPSPIKRRRSRTPNNSTERHPRLSPRRRSPRLSPKRRSPRYQGPGRRTALSPLLSTERGTSRRTRSPSFKMRSRSRSRTDRRGSRLSPRYRRSRSRELGYRRRNRDRSFSPLERRRRRRSISRSPNRFRREEKVSFLEELVAKLNETHQQPMLPHSQMNISSVNYMAPQLHPMPSHPALASATPIVQQPPLSSFFAPAPIPQPQPSLPQTAHTPVQNYDPYDESFFIGSSAASISKSSTYDEKSTTLSNQTTSHPTFKADIRSDKDKAKLFDDSRIKLSDFLAITAKPQVSSTSSAKLQEKVKVIQRCQEAIKILDERRYAGPLVVHKTNSYKYSKDMTVSPLLRKPIVQLPFTTPGIKKTSEMDFSKCCETLLYRVGLQKRLAPIKIQENKCIVTPKEVPQNDPPTNSVSSKPVRELCHQKVASKVLLLKGTQTDKELSSCKECLRRKGILYSNTGVQAGDPTLTFSVSTQVTEADFYSMIPRTQSLASLTPAQLLGKQSMLTEPRQFVSSFDRTGRTLNNQETLQRPRHIPSPPPPPSFNLTPSLLFNQSTNIPQLMQINTSHPSNEPFNDDIWSGLSKRY